jgi:toxin ParE1/3/4
MADFEPTARAEEDLIDIWLYVAQDNPGAADRLLNEIEEKFPLLAACVHRASKVTNLTVG